MTSTITTATTVEARRSTGPKVGGRILVGVDWSEESVVALRWALQEAALRCVTCEVINVWTPRSVPLEYVWGTGLDYQSARDARQQRLVRLVAVEAAAIAPAVRIQTRVEIGTPADVLTADPSVGMVVVGSRGRNAIAEAVLGSVSETCLHRSLAPLVVVPPGATDRARYGRIVIGVDRSPASLRAAAWAATEAEQRGDELTVMNAWHPPVVVANPYVPIAVDPRIGEEAGRDTLRHAASGMQTSTDVRYVLTEGDPRQILVEASATADLLVVGGDGHGAWVGGLVASVTQHCARHAHSPVAVVR